MASSSVARSASRAVRWSTRRGAGGRLRQLSAAPTDQKAWRPDVRLDSSIADPHAVAADLHSLGSIMWEKGRLSEASAERGHRSLRTSTNSPALNASQAVPYMEQAIRIKEQRGDEDLAEFLEDLEALKAGEPFPYVNAAPRAALFFDS